MEIKLENICKNYKKTEALKNINLTMKTPAMIGLVGPNGAGKSTLMKILVGQVLPTKGNITIDGQDFKKNLNYLKERLGYLPQDFGLYDELTVEEFLDYIACLKNINKNKKQIIDRCISETDLQEKRKAKIRTLSGGQKQRVGIAQAALNNPELFIVDEPTVGLDPEERIKFRNLFSKGAENKIVILSTHIIEDVESICNYLIVLNKGQILFNGAPNELVKDAIHHVGIIDVANGKEKDSKVQHIEKNYNITSSIITPEGIRYKIVGEHLPSLCTEVTPSLEDAYVYCMQKGGKASEEQL